MSGMDILLASELGEPAKTIFKWLTLAFPFTFVAIWCGTLWLLASTGGWRRLARTYPAHGIPEGRTCLMQSAQLGGWCGYNGCLKMIVAVEGLYLVPFFPFRIGHPPLFIPWNSMHHAKEWKFLWASAISIEIGDPCITKMKLLPKLLEGTPVKIG